MKPFERFLKHIFIALILCCFAPVVGLAQDRKPAQPADSIEISLLTCGPRQQVYSLYGHTAIRFLDKSSGRDLVVNYGVFSFDKPFFVLRFVFGLTDYEIGITSFDFFKWEYESTGCGVRQQVLNLTAKEKMAIAEAIDRNCLPENRTYRYNYFYDNCTTRARDILVNNINGKVAYGNTATTGHDYPSFRELIHAYNDGHRWARFGNDILLGVKADSHTNFEQQQFLPERLCDDFERAWITNADGTKRKLVSRSFWALNPAPTTQETGCIPSPTICLTAFALLTLAIAAYEWRHKRVAWIFDAAAMLVTGLCGLILLAMVFSQHPTVSLNLQILLLNPLNALMLYSVAKAARKNRIHWWTKAWTLLIIAFLLCGFVQTYAEGTTIVALSLLIRNISNIYTSKRHDANPTKQ